MNKSLGVWGSALVVGALIIPAMALAAEVRGGTQPDVASSEIIKNNLYVAGATVTSNGTIQGDLVMAGGTLLVSGPVSQDLLAAGGNVTFLGTVGDSVRAAGGNIIVDGSVKKDVAVLGGHTEISGAGVGGDVLWAGGSLRIDAPVGGSLYLRGGEVVINAPVHGNVNFKGNKLTLGPKAVIEGNLDYSAESEATMEAGATVQGKTTFEPMRTASSTPAFSAASIAALASLFVLWKFLSLLVFAFALGLLFRRFAFVLVATALSQPLLETGRGLVVFIVLPIVSVMLLATFIGIPLGALGLLSFAALMLVASSTGAIILGSLVHKWIFKPMDYIVTWQTILLGVILYTLLTLIPFLGGIVKFLFVLLALGAMTKVKWDVIKEWR